MTNDEYMKFEKYKYWLSEFVPEEMKNEAIEYFLSCDENMIQYILSEENVFNWENAILVIDRIGCPKNKAAVYSVMHALQDINCPMAKTAIKIISENYKYDRNFVVESIERIINKAAKVNDIDWLWGISCVVEMLKLTKADFSSNEYWDKLNSSGYWN